jgi:hypothetical protein
MSHKSISKKIVSIKNYRLIYGTFTRAFFNIRRFYENDFLFSSSTWFFDW